MTAFELFQAGQLPEAIAAQNEVVKKKPTDEDARFELFVFLCFDGDLERAEKQLDVLGTRDDKLRTGTLVFRNLLASELERQRVFEQGNRPVLPPGAPDYVEHRLQALAQLRSGETTAAESSVAAAIEATPATPGNLDDISFDGFCDFDDVLGSVLEVFAGGRYLWLPLEHVRSLEFSEPQSALDTLWLPAKLDDASGDSAQVHLPSRYARTTEHADASVRLGRSSDWEEHGSLLVGRGQRVWMTATGDETREHAASSVRQLRVGGA